MPTYLSYFGTSVPNYKTKQSELVKFMIDYEQLNEKEGLAREILYRASGIHTRYSVLPDFQGKETLLYKTSKTSPTISYRMKIYQEECFSLAKKAVAHTLNSSQINPTHLITISCTGMYSPGLDQELITHFELDVSLERTHINFMGCSAAFNGLKVASHIVQSVPEAQVLVVCLELCTLHFKVPKTIDQVLANALFSDGAASLLVSGKSPNHMKFFELHSTYQTILDRTTNYMGWYVEDDGFQMVLSQQIPDLLEKNLSPLWQNLGQHFNKPIENINRIAVHPGGKKILDKVAKSLKKDASFLKESYSVLRNNGNMSSPTILFILDQMLSQAAPVTTDDVLAMAFGPGLAIETALLQLYA